jgi:hypothetical protein
MEEARLSGYLATNVPTNLCYCAGHVLVMAGSRLKSGPVPPVMMNAAAFSLVLQRFGTPRRGEAQPGDVVSYYESKGGPVAHVAWVIRAGSPPKVISKDGGQRIYIVDISDVNPAGAFGGTLNPATRKKYVDYRVWTLPWQTLRVQVVAGPIEFVGKPTVTPSEPAVGDTVTVAVEYRVSNAPSAGLRMQEDATLVDASGSKSGSPQRKIQPLAPGPNLMGQAPSLVGRTSFQTRVTKPGTHSWLLELSAEKPTSMDEAAVDYEAVSKTVSFPVRARPGIADVQLSVAPDRIVEGGQGKISIGYTISGVPEPGRPPVRVTIRAAQKSPGPDPSNPVIVSLGQSQSQLNSPSGEVTVRKDVRINKAGGPGPRTITLTIRVEATGLPPVETTKDYSYEVFKRE